MKIVFLTMALFLTQTPAIAGHEGNGMGLICLPGTLCLTLAQAGLEIKSKTKDDFYRLAPAVVAEIENVLKLSGITSWQQKILLERSLGSTQTFEPATTIDSKKFSELKTKYIQILRNIDPYFKTTFLSFAAWSLSDQDKTYLLSEYFDDRKVSDRLRAFTLIHEGNVRNRGKDALEAAVKFDILLNSLLSGPAYFQSPQFDECANFEIFEQLGLIEPGVTKMGQLLKYLKKKGVDAIPYYDIFDDFMGQAPASVIPVYSKILKLAAIDPRLTLYMEKERFSISKRYYSNFISDDDIPKAPKTLNDVCIRHQNDQGVVRSDDTSEVKDLLFIAQTDELSDGRDLLLMDCFFNKKKDEKEFKFINAYAYPGLFEKR